MKPPSPLVVVVAVSARSIAQSLHRAGLACVALDLFEDFDTRQLALSTASVGEPNTFQISAPRVRAALSRIARDLARQNQSIRAVIYGSGIEAVPELIDSLRSVAPLAGNSRAAVQLVCEPRAFFGLLEKLGLPHPPVRFEPITGAARTWLVKCAGGSGGTHVRRYRSGEPLAVGEYLQADLSANPDRARIDFEPLDGAYSVTFLASLDQVRLLGVNRQWHGDDLAQGAGLAQGAEQPQSQSRSPRRGEVENDMPSFTYRGALSQVQLPAALATQAAAQATRLIGALGLLGLGSVDFLIHDGLIYWLEVNARPSASFELYEPIAAPGSLMAAHLAVCAADPGNAEPALLLSTARLPVRAHWHVFAPRELVVDARLADAWREGAAISDIPMPGSRIAAGMPICTVHAQAVSHQAAVAQLAAGQQQVWRWLAQTDWSEQPQRKPSHVH